MKICLKCGKLFDSRYPLMDVCFDCRSFINLQLFAVEKEGAQALNQPHYDDGTTSKVNTSKSSANTVPDYVPSSRRRSVWYESSGDLVGSANAGFPRCVHFQYYTAGTPIRDLHFTQTIKRKTPIRPNLSRLSLKKTTVFVPLNAVWDDAYLWESQQSDTYRQPVINMPSISVNYSDYNTSYGLGINPAVTATKWKETNNSFLDIVLNSQGFSTEGGGSAVTVVNITIPRAIKMSYNYLFRPKQSIPPYIEFTDTNPTPAEISIYQNRLDPENQMRRSTQRHSYVNSFRYNQQIGGSEQSALVDQAQHSNWQAMRAELLRQSDNQEKSDIEILQEFYGVKMPHENRPMVIGQKTVNLDDTFIAQSASTGEGNLGLDGAVTTFIDDEPLMDGFHSNVSGWILVFYEFQTEPVQLSIRNRESFLTSYEDYFRKDLLAVKDDVMYTAEISGVFRREGSAPLTGRVAGWKRKFSELTRLPSTFIGDVFDTKAWFGGTTVPITSELSLWLTNARAFDTNQKIDYSDLAIRAQSIDTRDWAESPDQFWFVGTKSCRFAVDDFVARELNLKKWGEE